MSEYQYYEFQALDRRLTAAEMARLRGFSSRARITPNSFVNHYEWGDFKGDEDAWMEQYFDAFLYFASWGTRALKLRLPSRLLDCTTADRYCLTDSVSAHERTGNTILSFNSEEEDREWPEEEDALSALIPIRTQLASGDLRSLYIGWLLCAQNGQLEEEDLEPPVPPGLGDLDGSLDRMVDFLRVDTDLLGVAAAGSPPLRVQTLTGKAIRTWIAGRPGAEKDDYLARFIAAEEPGLAMELQRLIGHPSVASLPSGARTVGELLRAAEEAAGERRRASEARAAAERQRREREAASARSQYLEKIARRQPSVWTEIHGLIATKQPANYDRAVSLLVDLRDVAVARGDEAGFRRHLDTLETEHARKPSLLERIQRAGLRGEASTESR